MTNQQHEGEEDQSEIVSLYFLMFSGLLATVLILSKMLHQRPVLNSFVSEAALVLLVAMTAGFFVHLFFLQETTDQTQSTSSSSSNNVDDFYYQEQLNDDHVFTANYAVAQSLLSFTPKVFYLALLPPILFNSGYELRRELFFRHIKPILLLACVGTTLAALTTGAVLYGIQSLGWMGGDDTNDDGASSFQPTLLELLAFGSLIAATDTVSVVAVFQSKKVDPHLFCIVFGESALNDAVAIVLFNTFSSFLVEAASNDDAQQQYDSDPNMARRATLYGLNVLVQAAGSPLLGLMAGLVVALIFKHVDLREHSILELSLYMLLLYMPFIMAELLGLSGIVTIFFTGMAARRYVRPNVSETTAQHSAVIFKLAAYLAETCIFLELGLSVFGLRGSFQVSFMLWGFLAAFAGRAVSIYPLSYLHNWSIRKKVSLLDLETATTVSDSRLTHPPTVFENSSNKTKQSFQPDEDDPQPQQQLHQQKQEQQPPNRFSSSMSDVASFSDDDGDDSSTASCSSGSTSSRTNISGIWNMTPPRTGVAAAKKQTHKKRRRRRRTPMHRKDLKISTNMAHIMCFCGLRGAVAYACARDFPDVYGHRDEIVAATMGIVLFSIIGMGGMTECLLRFLQIQMNVDEEEYMKEWHTRHVLKGAFHQFEEAYFHKIAVRQPEAGPPKTLSKPAVMVLKDTSYRQQHSLPNAFDYQAQDP